MFVKYADLLFILKKFLKKKIHLNANGLNYYAKH